MAFQIGHKYWMLRTKDGRDKIFPTPEDLFNAANEYFKYVLENPFKETVVQKRKINRDEEVIELVEVPKMRPMTLEGFCNFIDISVKGFRLYEERDNFIPITTRIRQIIENNQFEGATAGFLNPNIIARKLGLTDKSEVKITEEQPLFPDAD
jgi:hypothetical protein